MARLILDTGVLVDAYRGRLTRTAINSIDNVAVPAVVVTEFLHGVLLTPDPDRADRQRAFLQETLSVAPVLDYTRPVADEHALLAHDLIIAATARIVLITASRAHFGDLPDVDVRLAPLSVATSPAREARGCTGQSG